MRKASTVIALVVCIFSSTLSFAAEWGDLKLKFVYDGAAPAAKPISVTKDTQFCGQFNLVDEELVVNKDNGGISNIVGYMYTRSGPKPPIHPDYAAAAKSKVVLDNAKCRFDPHVVLLTTSQTLVLKNSDPVGHNTSYAGFRNVPFNDLIPSGGQLEKQLPVGGERAKVTCGIHPWMSAYVVVNDNPYGSVSNKDGVLQIKNVPAGKWTFQLWHGGFGGYVAEVKQDGKTIKWKSGRLELTIKPGMNDLGEFKYKPVER